MADKIKYSITTSDGKTHEVSKDNVDKYGIRAYADSYKGATIRMRDTDGADYDIPLEHYDRAAGEGLHAFSIAYSAPAPQAQPRELAQSVAEPARRPADMAAGMVANMPVVGGRGVEERPGASAAPMAEAAARVADAVGARIDGRLPSDIEEGAGVPGDGFNPTEPDKIRMLHGVESSMEDFRERTDKMAETGSRARGEMTAEGRAQARAGEFQARAMGLPTSKVGLAGVAKTRQEEAETAEGENPAVSSGTYGNSPRPYGVTVENGELKTRWMLPDGSLTTDVSEVGVAEQQSREERLQHEFEGNPSRYLEAAAQKQLEELEEREKQVAEKEMATAYSRREGESRWGYFLRMLGKSPNTQTGAVTRVVSGYDTSVMSGEVRDLMAERRILEQTLQGYRARRLKKGDGFFDWQNVVNFAHGVKDAVTDLDYYAMGALELQSMNQLLSIKAKIEKGEELSDHETALLQAQLGKQMMEESGTTPHGYNAGGITAEMIPFMVQMYFNPAGGIGKVAGKKAIRMFGRKLAKQTAGNALGKLGKKRAAAVVKGLGVTVGDVASSKFLADTYQASSTTADALRRYVGDVAVDENGNYSFAGSDGLLRSFAKADGAATIENYTEMLGGHLGLLGSAVGKGAGKLAKPIRKLGGGRLLDGATTLMTRVPGSDWAKGIAAIEEKAQWSGPVGEMLEEEAGIVLNSIFVGDNKLSDLVDKEQQIDIALGVGCFGAFVSGIKTAGYPVARVRARNDLRRREVVGRARFMEDWDGIMSAIDDCEEKDLGRMVGELVGKYANSDLQAKAIAGYADALVRSRGYNLARQAKAADPEMADRTGVEDSFEAGMELSDTGSMAAAREAFETQRLLMLGEASQLTDDIQVVLDAADNDPVGTLQKHKDNVELCSYLLDYVNAKATYDGMLQGVQDKVDERIAASDAQIDGRVNNVTGFIQPATMKVDDRRVFVVGGGIAVNEDGTIDHRASDASLVIRDAETGKLEVSHPKAINLAERPVDAAMAKSAAADAIRDQGLKEASDKINGLAESSAGEPSSVEYHLNDILELKTPEGEVVTGMVNAEVNEDGLIEVETSEPINGRVVNLFTPAQLAEMEAQRNVSPEIDSISVPKIEENVPNPTENAVSSQSEAAEPMTDAENVSETVSSPSEAPGAMTTVENGQQSALQALPRDEKGNPIFEQAESPEAAWDALVEFRKGDTRKAQAIADAMVEEARKANDRVMRLKPKGKTVMEMSESQDQIEAQQAQAQAAYGYWQKVAGVELSRRAAIRAQQEAEARRAEAEAKAKADRRDAFIADIDKADEDAVAMRGRDKEAYMTNPEPQDVYEAVAMALAGIKIDPESYRRETGYGLREQRGMVGMIAKRENGGVGLYEAALHIIENDHTGLVNKEQEAGGADDQAVAGIILDVLQEGNPRSYVIRHRQDMWERDEEYLRNREADYAEGMYGMSPQEAREYERMRTIEAYDLFEDFDEVGFNNMLADDYVRDKERLKNIEYGKEELEQTHSTGEGPTDGPGGAVLQGEAADEHRSARTGDARLAGGETADGGVGVGQDGALAGAQPSDRGAGVEDDSTAAGRNTDVRGGNTDDAANGELADGVTPSVGPFGEIYTQFKGKPQEAVTFLLAKRSGEAIGALHHKDIGDIDLVWGKEGTAHSDGYGLAKLAKFHPEVLFNLQEVLNDMVVTKRSTNRVQLESDKYQAAVRLTWDDKKKTWLLTMFEKKNSVPDNTTDTVETLSSNGNDTATPENTVISSDVRSVPAVGEGINTDTSEVNSGQTEGAAAPAGNSSKTSVGKDNALSTEKQTVGAESFNQPADNEKSTITHNAVETAQEEINPNPTEAQKRAGNYKMGHVRVDGHDISIENKKGSIRRGKDANGTQWESEMHNDYGYIRGTEGVDGDHIDVFLSDTPEQGDVFMVDQYNPDGSFDEHKVMYGFPSENAAREAYLSNYEPGWEQTRRLDVIGVSKEVFKKWIQSSKRKTKPFAGYSAVRHTCPVCGKHGIQDYKSDGGVCPQCGSDLDVFRMIDRLSEDDAEKIARDLGFIDNQGNPIDDNGNLIVESVESVDEITDKDFTEPYRTVGLPPLPEKVANAIGIGSRGPIIKKNVFEKNLKHHKELTPEDGRLILNQTLYNPQLYGQNQKTQRPYNWILVHLADKNSAVVVEVNNPDKDNAEIVNWHYIGGAELERKKRQAVKEGGLILTLSENNAAADTLDDSFSDGKDNTLSSDKQADGTEKLIGWDEPGPKENPFLKVGAEKPEAEPTKPSQKDEVKSMAGERRLSVGKDADGNREVYEAAKGMLEAAGVIVHEVSGEDARVMFAEKDGARMSAAKRRALDTMNGGSTLRSNEVGSGPKDHQGSVTTFDSAANVRQNLEKLVGKYDKIDSASEKTICGELSKALGLRNNGNHSNYGTFEAKNGTIVRIRISDHNAEVKNFDDAGYDNGISIVVSRKANEGLNNNGEAHIVEYFYNGYKLAKANGHPLAEIAHSMQQLLYSGEFKDTTGLAERQEVNGSGVRELRDDAGVVYGWATDGEVYLNREAMNPETPLHEYTHLWDMMVERENPELWARGKELMKETPLWDEVKNDPAYSDIRGNDDAIASEVHSRLTGRRGAELLEGMMRDAHGQGVFNEAEAVTLVSRLRKWLRDMFAGLKKTLGRWSNRDLRNLTTDDFVKMTLRDLAEGVNPNHRGKELVTLHNISEGKLRKALKAGGLANPSMAVVRAGLNSHEGYGSITLVARGSIADKRSGRNAGTWAGDAWTPMYPPVEREQSALDRAAVVSDISRTIPNEMRGLVTRGWESHLSGGNESSLAYWFLSERGAAPEIARRQRKYSPALSDKVLGLVGDRATMALSVDEAAELRRLYIANELDGDVSKYDKFMELSMESAKERLGKPSGLMRMKAEASIDMMERQGLLPSISTWVNDIRSDERMGERVDEYKTSADANAAIGDKGMTGEFERWIEELDKRYGVEEKLFAGYTASGYRRLVPNTIENASRIMRSQGRNASHGGTGFSSFVASVLKPMSTHGQMRGQSDKLSDSHADTEEFDKKWGDVYYDLAIKCQADAERISDDYGFYRLMEAAEKRDPAKHLKDEYGIELNAEDISRLGRMIDAIREVRPVKYFETKFERPVRLDEFAMAVVPENIDSELRQALESTGLRIETYSSDKGGDRQRAVARAANLDGVRFHAVNRDRKPTWRETYNALSDSLSHVKNDTALDSPSKSDVAKLARISENLKKKAEIVGDNGLGMNELVYELAQAIEEKSPSSNKSNYNEVYIAKAGKTTIRISGHPGETERFGKTPNNVGIVIKTSNHNFRNKDDVNYVEFVYYGDKVEGNAERQRSIINGLRHYIETGSFERMPEADRLNTSGRYRDAVEGLGDKTKFRDGESEGARLLAIRGLKPIEVESNSLNKAELQEVYRNLPSVEKDGREIEFYHSAFKKIYKKGGLFGQIVPVLDQVLEQSVLAYSEKDNRGGEVRPDGSVHKYHPNVTTFDNYVGKVVIGGKEFYVRTTVENGVGQSGAHSFFVSGVEVYEKTADGLSVPNFPSGESDHQRLDNPAGETTSTEIPRVKPAADGIVDAKLRQFFERASVELLPHDMRQRAMELSEKLHTPIRLVDSADEAMENPSARHRRAKGWATDTGEIVVIVPNHSDVADIENTVVHEIVGHDGLEAMIGPERMDEFVTEVYGHATQGIKKKIDARADKEYYDDIDRMTRQKGGGVFARAEATVEANSKKRDGHYQREATKEYMADMAGEIGDKGFERMSQEVQTLWGKIKAKVQQFLDKFLRGLKIAKSIRLTDKDLAYILYKAWKHKRDGGVFSKAEDAVMRRKTGWGESPLVEISARDRASFREEAVGNKIESLFDEAIAGNLTGKPVEVGRLTAEGKNYLEKLSGKQMRGVVSFVINPSDMVHIYRRHFGKNEKDGRNIPLTKADIRMMHKIVCSPDRVVYAMESNCQKRGMFFFLKKSGA